MTLYFPAGHRLAVELVEPGGHAYPGLHSPLQLDVFMPVVLP